MTNEALRELLGARRNRIIATILGVKERECDEFLPPEAQAKLRKAVLDQVNEFYDLAVDLIRASSSSDVIINELWVQKVNEIHEAVVKNGG